MEASFFLFVRLLGFFAMMNQPNSMTGYTIVELMLTIVIVAFWAAAGGTFLFKLLTVQEREREEAFIREKLSDICGEYADMMSVGSSFSINGTNNQEIAVTYRSETGGVSLETGLVSHVSYLTSTLNTNSWAMDIKVRGFDLGKRLSRSMNGNAVLIPQFGDLVAYTITPLRYETVNDDPNFNGFQSTDAALGNLKVAALYKAKNDEGWKTVAVERVVRLWNQEKK